ncbi:hypothetical protein PNK_1517 [Candidatus Protochlamydia naegleriophila]|uniref:F-box domain-containing protein n=1 Tax=Candidatus Protochlamydia naegleriophila TaxID=389348 RepID=A0A0U5JD96_9BACT|nr:F-box protein [Candidatus Protochlamydia naegleriophila]CUI17127.1 hypothetical protein PNK_1517 [Candidatus Protochlamydia naegleriophila]
MNFNYTVNSNFNNCNNTDLEMKEANQHKVCMPSEIWNHIFNYVDDYSLSNVTRVCWNWYSICHTPFFDGWAFLYRTLWKEGVPPNDTPPFTHFTFRYRAVGFTNITDSIYNRISISDSLLSIRQSEHFLHFIVNCLNPTLDQSTEQLNDLSSHQHVTQWINNVNSLFENGRALEAHYLIQEIVHIQCDKNQLNKLQQIRSQILKRCLVEHISSSERERTYSIFQSLFSSFAPLSDFVKGLSEPWPILYGAAQYDFSFLMNGFLFCQHPDIYDEGPLLLQTAAETKSFATLDALLSHQPLAANLDGSTPGDEFPLHALCSIDEQMMDEREQVQWMRFMNILLERGYSLMQRNQENDTPYSIAAKNFNPSMLQYLFNKTDISQANGLNLQSILAGYIESLDVHSNEFDESDYVRCRFTLEVLLAICPSLKDHIQLNSLLFWHLPLFESLVKYTQSQEQAYIGRLIKTLLNLPKLHVNHLIVNYQDEEELINNTLEDSLNAIFQSIFSFIPYINRNVVDKRGRTIIHLLIGTLRNVEELLEDADDPIKKKQIFQCCFNHYCALISQLANENNCRTRNVKGKTAYQMAENYGYTALLPLLNPERIH